MTEGTMEDDERTMIRGVFGLDETTAREIMTPRIDIAAVDTESTPDETRQGDHRPRVQPYPSVREERRRRSWE